MTLEKPSPCKVNLLLNILGKRPDGFHELETVMHPVGLCDQLSFQRGGGGVRLTCSEPSLPVDASNLVHRAATQFLELAHIKEGVSIHLEKRIPMAAGLGGGSANAAVALVGLNELFGSPLGVDPLHIAAAKLGSDVPFFLQDDPALATGRGEIIHPLKPLRALHGTAFVLIHPGFGIPTAWAYAALGGFPNALHGTPGRAESLIERLANGSLPSAADGFYNSLEAPALKKYPLLALIKEFLIEQGAPVALMSGSGSVVFGIAPTESAAKALEEGVQARFGPCWTAVAPVI